MKNYKLLALAACFFAASLMAQTADQYVAAGRASLVAHDLAGAYTNFNAAATLSATNETANALLAVTRLLVLPQQPAGSNFLNGLGFAKTNRDIYNWMSEMPQDTNGSTVWPANYNSSTAIAFYRGTVMTALAASATNLANIKDPNFILLLLSSETTHAGDVTLDYGDVQLLRAMVAAGQFAGYTISAQNASVVIPTLRAMSKTNGLTLQSVLAAYPSLLTLSSAADLAASKGALTNAIGLYFPASDFIRNVRTPGAVRLFNLGSNEVDKEEQFRTELTNALLSLKGPVQIDPPQTVSINASNYFSGARTLRSLLPQFYGDQYVNHTLPDYTFGGILVNEPACDVEALLREHLGSTLPGIYLGDNFGSGSTYALFVGTNLQASIVGDDGSGNGVLAKFDMDRSGNWQFAGNNVFGVSGYDSYGYIYQDYFNTDINDFWGQLIYTNGISVGVSGSQLPALGPFQNAAGYYSGTFSGSGSGGSFSGPIFSIVAADGELFACPVNSDGSLGLGVSSQFDSNNHFMTMNLNGTVVAGALNTNTFALSGAFTNTPSNGSGKGTFSMTRSAKVLFDVPPVITTAPASKTAPLGTNITFSLTATGSPPLCYQWYFNDTVIPQATTASLTISNVTWTAAGNYSVTVSNVVGGSNAVAVLTVVPETVKPSVAITAPANGQRWSNSVFAVTGTARDNAQVSNVWFQVNSNGWQLATPGNTWTNWTATASLIPGTNLLQAYAVDTSGNNSTNASANLVYVVSDTLQVRTIGTGTLSPNYSNTVLEIGKSFSMTATAGSGFAFTNWNISTNWLGGRVTNNATVQFTMASNLTLQATFADVAKPVLTITNLTAGQRVSNAVFTVKGTASDNAQVANVQYQVNGGGWTNASGTTVWSAVVNLIPGTNAIQAYATDTTGNTSVTASVSLDFVVTNQLEVRATGLGTISPNYSNAWLELGRNYSMTATPASGFVCTNWVVSTDWLGGVATNSTTVQFMMQSNLTLQVNFADTTKPTLTITVPTPGQHMTNALANVKGTASDNWKVNAVWYQLTSGTWSLANTTNNYTNWTTTLTLAAGTNTVKAYAVDLGGNLSTTSSVSVISSNTFKLQLNFAVPQPLANNGLNFGLQVSPGVNGTIQVSSNLVDWLTLTSFVGTNPAINLLDATATNYNQRFYRAVVP